MSSRMRDVAIVDPAREDRRDYMIALIFASVGRLAREAGLELAEGDMEHVETAFDYPTVNPRGKSHINDALRLSDWPRR